MTRFFFLFAALVFLAIPAWAIDKQPPREKEPFIVESDASAFLKHRLSIGFSQRLDDAGRLNHSSYFQTRYYFYWEKTAAVVFGMSFSQGNSFQSEASGEVEIYDLLAEAGLRLQPPPMRLTPFFEPTILLHNFEFGNAGVRETRAGLGLRVGAALALHRKAGIELSLFQLINNVNKGEITFPQEIFVNPGTQPIEAADLKRLNQELNEDLFNPAGYQLQFFFTF